VDVVARRPLLVEHEKDANADPPRTTSKRPQIFEQSQSLRNCLATFVIALLTPFRSERAWSAPQRAAHHEELRVTFARYAAGLCIPSAECGAWVL